jgi:hypothetical protein
LENFLFLIQLAPKLSALLFLHSCQNCRSNVLLESYILWVLWAGVDGQSHQDDVCFVRIVAGCVTGQQKYTPKKKKKKKFFFANVVYLILAVF